MRSSITAMTLVVFIRLFGYQYHIIRVNIDDISYYGEIQDPIDGMLDKSEIVFKNGKIRTFKDTADEIDLAIANASVSKEPK
jgi:hypothetical protein